MPTTHYIVIIPAYNEESTIIDCLVHVMAADKAAKGYILDEIVVCVNGCTDATEKLVRNWQGGPIKVIKSRPGYINAMNRLFRYAKQWHPTSVMIKTDADGKVETNAFSVLFTQLERHPDIIVAGGHPTPITSGHRSPYRRFMSRLLSVRSRTPEAEVTVTDTSTFHQYAAADPIPELRGREDKLKVYFHGRLWCARSSQAIPFLPQGVIGDDVYLPGWLLQHHGPRSMRLDYRAKVRFHPNDSLARHWKVYRRIYEDRKLVYSTPEFKEYVEACPLRLDWKYILRTCPMSEVGYFILYATLVRIEKLSYKYSTYDSLYWQYGTKET